MEQKAKEAASHAAIPVSISAMLVTLGVVYGDIGTSPMYVTKALVAGNGGIGSVTEEFVLGALSLVVWTVTLLTTVKYVLISLRADNHGEGGIFALYSLVKRCGKWLIIPAMLGGAALLADGILTPAVTVTTAIEGLRTIPAVHAVLGDDQGRVVAITLAIIIALFLVQRIGTAKIGHAFGPIMTLWFLFLGGTGLFFVFQHPAVLLCLNPLRGIGFLLSPNNHAGIMILGSCFLATTGAEALYSDMGHVGRGNIYATWPFVKCCLLLSYMGQGAWLINNAANPELMGIADLNPFYQMLTPGLRPFAVGLSTVAAIIASQALITGAFSLVSEASRLDLMPHMQVFYPAETKGQLYIPMVNNGMLVGCVVVVLLFQNSAHMEAAYGLAITLTMMCTTLLLFFYLSGLVVNIVCCLTIIEPMPLEGAALSLTATKVWVAILTVGYFQWVARPMSPGQWLLMLAAIAVAVGLWWSLGMVLGLPREVAELAGLLPLLALFWYWRPPPAFEKEQRQEA